LNKKISQKDKKDWETFIESNEKIIDKDFDLQSNKKTNVEKTIDLHGYSLENANKTIEEFIEKSYLNSVNKIIIITGKGTRSKNKVDPYQSNKLGILKYSVPEFLSSNSNLKKIIKNINYEDVNNPSKGSFEIILKKIKV